MFLLTLTFVLLTLECFLKPIRVELKDFYQPLMKGDYLRVHHSPKRFPMINNFDWGISIFDDDNGKDDASEGDVLPGVIVKENPDAGYIIVNKPPGVPVHPTVGEYIVPMCYDGAMFIRLYLP